MNRDLLRGVAVVGVACTLLSAVTAWFSIPVGVNAAGTDRETVQVARPWITPFYQAVAVAVPILLLVVWRWRNRGSYRGLIVAGLWFASLLAYPYCVLSWDPTIAGHAAWLEAQHYDLVSLYGEVSTSSESYSAGTMDRLCMTDTPQLVTPTLLRERQLAESSLAYLPDFVDRLGYSNKFFEFIRLGWIAALIGGVLLIVWTCSVPDGVDLRRVLRAAAISAAAFLAVCAFAWGWSFLAVAKLDRAAERTAGGEYREARRELQRAAALFPVLNQDTYFVLQTGLVEDALGEATLAARLYRASVLEQSGCRYQADLVCAQLMAESPDGSAVRREACRSLLRSAIDEVNAGRNNEAMNGFEAILAVDPCNLKAVYGMQLACLRAGHYQRAVALARRIDATYVYFQFPSRQATQFLSHMLATAADYGMGDADAAVVEARKVLEQ